MVSALIALVNGLSRWICRVDHESAVAVLVSYGLAVIQGRIVWFNVLHLFGHILGFLEHSGTSIIFTISSKQVRKRSPQNVATGNLLDIINRPIVFLQELLKKVGVS